MITGLTEEILCGCGYSILGEEEAELLQDADDHVRTVHPELVGTLSPLELASRTDEDEVAA